MADEFDDNPRFDYRGGNFRLNGRIMIAAIICLFVVIIMVVLLHIYARCVLRRQARRRAAIRQLTIVTTTNTTYPNEQPKRGLDESVIALLPTFVYKTVDCTNSEAGSNPIECSVCLSLLEDGEIARLLPNCNHTFHAECIDMWLRSHSTCPICRTEAEPRPIAEQSSSESVVELGVIGVAVPATAPPTEGTSSGCANSVQCSAKVGRSESSSRLSSFRRMLTRERSERRTQTPADGVGDIERQ